MPELETIADKIRDKFARIAELQKEAEELYANAPAGSLDADDDTDIWGDIADLRWLRICETHEHQLHNEIVDDVLADPCWVLED
jgi:hypothetical protein